MKAIIIILATIILSSCTIENREPLPNEEVVRLIRECQGQNKVPMIVVGRSILPSSPATKKVYEVKCREKLWYEILQEK